MRLGLLPEWTFAPNALFPLRIAWLQCHPHTFFLVFLLPFWIVAQLHNDVLKKYANRLRLCIHVTCLVSPEN